MIKLTPGFLTLPQLRQIARGSDSLELDPGELRRHRRERQDRRRHRRQGQARLRHQHGLRTAREHAHSRRPARTAATQSRAVACGRRGRADVATGRASADGAEACRASARGHSGIRREVIDALITLFNADVLPVIPVKGSVGASGDLAPLAHMSTVLLGIGEVTIRGERVPARWTASSVAGLKPMTLQAKEGLALLNGTQASTALALYNMFAIEDLFRTGARGGRAVGRCGGRVGRAVRCAHPRIARASRADRGGGALIARC